MRPRINPSSLTTFFYFRGQSVYMNSKVKGASYERWVCKKLSLWISEGKHEDLLWRSSLSGGRATVSLKRGGGVRQAGDVCAVAPGGHDFCNLFYIECKHVRKLDIEAFCINGNGILAKFWRTARREAKKHGKQPVIICRQNRTPDLAITLPEAFSVLGEFRMYVQVRREGLDCDIFRLEEVLQKSCSALTTTGVSGGRRSAIESNSSDH